MEAFNLIESGIYSVSEAAALVGATERKVRGWIEGYEGAAPLIDNQIGWIDNRLAFSFTNLMEMRFVAFFVKAGVKLRQIRAIMSEVKHTVDHPHPFATRTVFLTDGKKIVAEIARKNGIKKIYDLKTRNYEMRTVVLTSLKDDVEYDPSGDIRLWRPRPTIAPHVILHPKFSFGHPVLEESHVPTATLRDAYAAEGSATAVADLYELPVKRVREALSFEKQIRMAA
ncbi:hypothetical protein BH11PSE3_BH11PSE3_08910 [soil metagenome]